MAVLSALGYGAVVKPVTLVDVIALPGHLFPFMAVTSTFAVGAVPLQMVSVGLSAATVGIGSTFTVMVKSSPLGEAKVLHCIWCDGIHLQVVWQKCYLCRRLQRYVLLLQVMAVPDIPVPVRPVESTEISILFMPGPSASFGISNSIVAPLQTVTGVAFMIDINGGNHYIKRISSTTIASHRSHSISDGHGCRCGIGICVCDMIW